MLRVYRSVTGHFHLHCSLKGSFRVLALRDFLYCAVLVDVDVQPMKQNGG